MIRNCTFYLHRKYQNNENIKKDILNIKEKINNNYTKIYYYLPYEPSNDFINMINEKRGNLNYELNYELIIDINEWLFLKDYNKYNNILYLNVEQKFEQIDCFYT